jgi:MFS family permease
MQKFRWYDHLAVNLFWLALNIRNNAVGSLFMPYLVDTFANQEIKNSALGALRFAGLVVAMLVQPAMGLLSDRSTARFGRRRPFLAFGVLLDLLFLATIYYAWDFASLVIAILLLQFSSNISHGPLQALIPDLVPENQRGVSSGIKAIFELIPLILVGAAIAPLLGMGRMDLAMYATGGSLLVILILTLLLVKEEPLREKLDIPFGPPMLRVLGMLGGLLGGGVAGLAGGALVGWLAWQAARAFAGPAAAPLVGISVGFLVAMILAVWAGVLAGVRLTLGGASRHDPPQARTNFTWWVINRLLFLAAITSIQSFMPFFLMYVFNIDRNQAISLSGQLLTVVGIFTLLTALSGGWLSDRYGHHRSLVISAIIAGLGSFLLLSLIALPNITLIYLSGSILGLATGLFMTANWALGTKLVPPQEAGRYMGISNLAGAGAGIVGATLGGPVADYLNTLDPGIGYYVLFACYGVLFLLSAASLLKIQLPAYVNRTAVEIPAP